MQGTSKFTIRYRRVLADSGEHVDCTCVSDLLSSWLRQWVGKDCFPSAALHLPLLGRPAQWLPDTC
jgi:hypothetical protein